jgi:hypothetical protein
MQHSWTKEKGFGVKSAELKLPQEFEMCDFVHKGHAV